MVVFIITGCFILMDFVTGLVKAFKEKNYNSSIMRQGLYHKCGSILCVGFGGLIDYAQTVVELGFTVPISVPVCIYIMLMEIGSIIENICAINPEIMSDKLKQYFEKLKK